MTDKGLADADVSGTHERYAVRHFRAQVSAEGVNKNQAESFFSRLRRWKNGVSGGVRPFPIAHLPEDVLLHGTAQGRDYMLSPATAAESFGTS